MGQAWLVTVYCCRAGHAAALGSEYESLQRSSQGQKLYRCTSESCSESAVLQQLTPRCEVPSGCLVFFHGALGWSQNRMIAFATNEHTDGRATDRINLAVL